MVDNYKPKEVLKMNEETLLLRDIYLHTFLECLTQLAIYENMDSSAIPDKMKIRLMQQVFRTKLQQKNSLSELSTVLFEEHLNEELKEDYKELKDWNYEEITRIEENKIRQLITNCLIEEVEYLNELQMICNYVNKPEIIKDLNTIVTLQHQIIYKLMMVQAL